jgi:hypothetical protein
MTLLYGSCIHRIPDAPYVRNGTQNLFAALRVHSGEVSAMPAKTRNRFDLLRFLDQLETEIPPAAGDRDQRQPLHPDARRK